MSASKSWMRWAAVVAAPMMAAALGSISCVGAELILPTFDGGTAGDGSTCSSPFAVCGSACTDPRVDVQNCGACGHACAAGEVCVASACATSCPSNLEVCGSTCVDARNDPMNCGTCGHACALGEVCFASKCTSVSGSSCPSNLAVCSSTCVDTKNDPTNCGTCGHACALGEVCFASACTATGSSCADLKAHFGFSADGSYVIQPIGKKPFTVYCKDLASANPKEYLTLVNTHANGSMANFSGYYCANCSADAYNYFEKVKIDPETLVVDITDVTFASWTSADMACWATIGGACGTVRHAPFATAGNCILNGGATPGNVDLRGTTFSIDPSVVMVGEGSDYYGMSTFNADRTVLTIAGGGACGGQNPDKSFFQLKQD